jgi:hypothetical protein
MKMEAKSKRGGKRPGAGRPPKAVNNRTPDKGKIIIRLSPEAALQLQSLMLRHVDGVKTPEDMLEHLIRQELEKPYP